MVGAGGNGDDVADAGGDIGLTVVVIAPADDGAIGAEGEGMEITGGNGDDVA